MSSYILTGKTKSDGCIVVSYTEGFLNSIKLEFKTPLTAVQFKAFIVGLPYLEENVNYLERLGLTITKDATNEKIALFCRLYEKHVSKKYKVFAHESGKIKLIKIDHEILTTYFTSSNFLFLNKYSISNLVKYYNELIAEIATGSQPKAKHPNHFDQNYQNKLTQKELPDYWAHLKSLGYEHQKDRVGNSLGWEKKSIV